MATRGVLRAGDRLRPAERDRRRAGRRPHHAQLRRPAAELPAGARGAARWASRSIRCRKGWNMIGWRMGWVCGNERIVRAFADVKDNSDSGQFIAIQKAAAAALDDAEIPAPHPGEVPAAAGEAGRHAPPLRLRLPDARRLVLPLHAAARRAWPAGRRSPRPRRASQYLITEHSICTVPWDDAGPYPAVLGHLRGRRRGGRRRPDGRNRTRGSEAVRTSSTLLIERLASLLTSYCVSRLTKIARNESWIVRRNGDTGQTMQNGTAKETLCQRLTVLTRGVISGPTGYSGSGHSGARVLRLVCHPLLSGEILSVCLLVIVKASGWASPVWAWPACQIL